MVSFESFCCLLVVRIVYKDVKCCRNCSKFINYFYRVKNFEKKKNIFLFVSIVFYYMNVKFKFNFFFFELDFLKFFLSFKFVEINIIVIVFYFFEVICCLNLLEMKFIYDIF